MTMTGDNMQKTSNPSDAKTILDGIRRWVEIETPTEAPRQVDKLATTVVEGYRVLPCAIERVVGQSGGAAARAEKSSPGARASGASKFSSKASPPTPARGPRTAAARSANSPISFNRSTP